MAALTNGVHSPLGASGMKRWEACLFSVFATAGLPPNEEDDDNEHSALGTSAHSLIEECMRSGQDTWEQVGQSYGPNVVDKNMAVAGQQWLDLIRKTFPDRNQGNSWIERKFHCPSIHRLFYGTSDFIYYDALTRTLHVWDYKHGVGVVVEARDNPQGLYYGAGAIEELGLWDLVDVVVIHIVQPRAAHWEGPHREWAVPAEFLGDWVEETLIPAMNKAERMLQPNAQGVYEVPAPVTGDHCQFCPVSHLKCPALLGATKEIEPLLLRYENLGIEGFTPEERGQFMDLFERLKVMNKANTKEVGKLFASGKRVPGFKQVPGKVNRKWPEAVKVGEAEVPFPAFAREKFGEAAFTAPELKSPAQIEELPEGKTFATRHAFKPEGGLVVVRDTDSRPEVSRDTKALFKPVKKTKETV